MDIFTYKIIPVIQIEHAEDAQALGEALVAGGLPVAEITLRTPAAAESIAIMSEIEGLTVGAGTVLTPQQVEMSVEAGAQFLVSPGFRTDVVREAKIIGKPILPGVATPTEIMTVLANGIDTVKFFPANLYGGPAAIKALSAPFNTVKFVPTGGVNTGNLKDYLSLFCIPAVGGSWMVPVDLMRAHDFAAIAAKCKEAVELAAA